MQEARVVKTTCPYCGVGCGVLATQMEDGSVEVKGDPDHPSNFGKLCSKGAALGETLGLETRLLFPQIRGKRASWDDALSLVADRFSSAIRQYGPDSVAFYVSGQILTEDYYVANKLMKGFLGSANIDTNSRLCMASSVAGHKRAFGADTVPCSYEDLEDADLLVLVGSNLAWCHPVLQRRIEDARKSRPHMKVVVIDPRETASSDGADLHLAIAPDGDVALFSGLLAYLSKAGVVNHEYVRDHTAGFVEALNEAQRWEEASLVEATGLSAGQLHQFYDLFARTSKTVTLYSQGVNQSVSGTDKVNAILNCHLATGRIGQNGMGPFSITGQPNAMGGREVGGLANTLAAHMELDNTEHRSLVKQFWKAPALAPKQGMKAVELFDAVASGRIKALWIMGTNPADSLPNAGKVEAALASCPFVVVSEVVKQTDTSRHAHVLLPSAAWGEKSGTVTNSERRISRQRPFLPMPGEAKPDYWQFAQVARRMGFRQAFDYGGPDAVFREHATLSSFANAGARDFDIGAYADITAEAYAELSPFQWPAPSEGNVNPRHFFAEGGFYHADKKARFIPLKRKDHLPARKSGQTKYASTVRLNTGRIRDQWHTMSRTGLSARLSAHSAEPFLEISPQDAEDAGLQQADIAQVTSPHGSVLLRVVVTSRQKTGAVFAPLHWTDQFATNARIDRLVTADLDPFSGQPAYKHTDVSISPFNAVVYGFAVTRNKPSLKGLDYAAAVRCDGGWRMDFAHGSYLDQSALLKHLRAPQKNSGHWSEYRQSGDAYRAACFDEDGLVVACLTSAKPVSLSRSHLVSLLAKEEWSQQDRLSVLAGFPSATQPSKGAIVCACMNVGVNEIGKAIAEGAHCVDSVAEITMAGTNCGSCRTEIERMLHGQFQQAAQ
ncbi:Nitrate reductase [Pseudovibrio axinellae]|uniref:Nitrate reductase n=1 Tax=Pseudovibrio axinellae TaxID=989403 RepID=A0A166BDL8_9HYPH|nr:nitrate reductase [Pseudovibrio axinellae]KZL22158.1 Nitrate reductase [Pseudovibrio axinellae]SEQ53027.1 assimilatory nitrate reductase (NADH) alpha subunit apoprotein [Pseudovibrio axinellae]